MGVIYAALTLPAAFGIWASRFRTPFVVLPVILASSVIFFVTTNFAVWAFSGMYATTAAGLVSCYIAAIPFFQNTLAGDIMWTCALFGGWFLARSLWSTAAAFAHAHSPAGLR